MPQQNDNDDEDCLMADKTVEKLHIPLGIVSPYFLKQRLSRGSRVGLLERLVSINLDRVCKFAFPLAFLVFLVIYWTYYLYLD